MSPEQEAAKSGKKKLFKERQPGTAGGRDFINSQTEHNFRQKFEGSAAVAAQAGGGATPQQSLPPVQNQPPIPPAPLDLRFHKWARYVIVAKKHPQGEDTVLDPAYSESLATGYAKAVQIATRDNERVSLIIIGGGGSYKESLALTHPLVDVYGWGNPIIEGAFSIPTIGSPIVDGITFHSVDGNAIFTIPAIGMPTVDPLPLGVPRIFRCHFYGTRKAFYAQRMFYAENCTFWQERQSDGSFVDPSLELAAVMIEMETPQRWWSVMKGCRLFTGISAGIPEREFIPYNTSGYAIKVSSGPGGIAPMPNFISSDGVFRTNGGSSGGRGSFQSGVLLDSCEIYGSARVREWILAHEHCTIYGGLPFPERNGGCYAWISGHDYIAAGSFDGRQFGVVLFDGGTCIHSSLIAEGIKDPNTENPLFTGGVAVFIRNSLHMARYDGVAGAATRSNGTTVMGVYIAGYPQTAAGYPGAVSWATGPGSYVTSGDTATNLDALWHPLFE